jgi:hypothetical protein
MSTDTDYVITIKGKDAALRKAAADFMELALNPWNPQRNDKKTLTRLDVFRNESKSAGFFTPSSLCEEAAKLFPGVSVSFSSKNEYGYTEEGAWVEKGSPPIDVPATVVEKVFERIQAEVDKPEARISWLEPLVEWGAAKPIPSAVIDAIRGALEAAEISAREVAEKRRAQADQEAQREVEGVENLQSLTRWNFHPVLTVECQRLGELGRPELWSRRSGWDDSEQSNWGEFWDVVGSGDHDLHLEQFAEGYDISLAVAVPIIPESPAASKFLNQIFNNKRRLMRMRSAAGSNGHEMLEYQDTNRVFLRSPKDIWAGEGRIIRRGTGFLWLHFAEHPPQDLLVAEAKKSMRLVNLLRGASVWGVADEKMPIPELQDCLAVSSERIFLVTKSASAGNVPSGRMVSLALSDGSLEWVSEIPFQRCGGLIVSENSAILAVCIDDDNSPQLVSIESLTGKELWRTPMEHPSDCRFQLAASPDILVVLACEYEKAHVSFYRVSSGEKVAEKTFSEADQPKVVMDGLRVYVADYSWVAAFTHDGEDAWTIHLPNADACNLALSGVSTILLSRGNLGSSCLRCETGSVVWSMEEYCYGDPCVVGPGEAAFFATRKEIETPDYTEYRGMCSARSIIDGALLWQSDIKNPGNHPLVATDKAVVFSGLEWFDTSSGAKLGSLGFPKAGGIMTSDGTLLCTGSSWQGTYQLVCLDSALGCPSGAWPMGRQNAGGAAYLPTQRKTGYKQFIKAWKDGEDLSHRLAKFAANPDGDKARVARIHGIIRGHELTAQARSWVEPSIGSGKTAIARGAQWRLVMAYGGFELLAKSLVGAKDGGLDDQGLSALLGKLSLQVFEPLAPPPIEKSTLKEWMDEEDASDVLDFLKMDKGDRTRFDAWLAKQKPIATCIDALLLAKAFRNATAHGALSPTKVEEWKLGEAVSRLTDEISRIDEAIFEVLGHLEAS